MSTTDLGRDRPFWTLRARGARIVGVRTLSLLVLRLSRLPCFFLSLFVSDGVFSVTEESLLRLRSRPRSGGLVCFRHSTKL
jgi:hypothetical protein